MRGANLKLRQANARAQPEVARVHARVCRGLATPLHTAISLEALKGCGCNTLQTVKMLSQKIVKTHNNIYAACINITSS